MTDQTDETPNEIVAAAKAHADTARRAAGERARRWPLATIGVGAAIGSAAVAAAVLFARRRERDD